MFDYLYAEAYELIRQEIESIAKDLLSDDNDDNIIYYTGQLNAINKVIQCMNAIQSALNEALEEEVKRLEEEEKENV